MFSNAITRRSSTDNKRDAEPTKIYSSSAKKQSEKKSSRKMTFENMLKYIESCGDVKFTAHSVNAMVEDIYMWSCVNGDTPIRLPGTDSSVKKMIPEGSVMDTRRSSKEPSIKESEKLDRNIEIDTASIVSSSNANERMITNTITRGFANFGVDPGTQARRYPDYTIDNEAGQSYEPAPFGRQRGYSYRGQHPVRQNLPYTEEEEYEPHQRVSVSRLHNSQPFAHIPDSPLIDNVVPVKKTRMTKVKKPIVNTAE